MDTSLVMRVVGSRLNDLQELRAMLKNKLGTEPSLNLRLEIMTGADSVVIAVNDDQIVVRDERLNKVIATGDWNLARMALKGMDATAADAEADSAPPTDGP